MRVFSYSYVYFNARKSRVRHIYLAQYFQSLLYNAKYSKVCVVLVWLARLSLTLPLKMQEAWRGTHVGHVQLKHYGFRMPLIFTFVFLLVSPAGLDQSKISTKQKTQKPYVYDLW